MQAKAWIPAYVGMTGVPSPRQGSHSVAITRMTPEQISASGGGRVDRARIEATDEDAIRQQMIEDGEDPDAEPRFAPPDR